MHPDSGIIQICTFLVVAQNAGGEFTQPIGNTSGKATNGLFPSLVGKTMPNFGKLSTLSWI